MASYCRVVVVGNLTRDPEVRYLPSGQAVCDLGVAINDRVKKGNEWVDEPTFLDVTLWEKTAETAGQYLRKGSQVLIEGRLRQESWNDKTTGDKRTKLKIIGDRMVMLGSRADGAGSPSRGGSAGGYDSGDSAPAPRSAPPRAPAARAPQAPPPAADAPPASGDEDDLPF